MLTLDFDIDCGPQASRLDRRVRWSDQMAWVEWQKRLEPDASSRVRSNGSVGFGPKGQVVRPNGSTRSRPELEPVEWAGRDGPERIRPTTDGLNPGRQVEGFSGRRKEGGGEAAATADDSEWQRMAADGRRWQRGGGGAEVVAGGRQRRAASGGRRRLVVAGDGGEKGDSNRRRWRRRWGRWEDNGSWAEGNGGAGGGTCSRPGACWSPRFFLPSAWQAVLADPQPPPQILNGP